ncbi:hypothetical protein PHLGIDRAFT_122361 [Phlebiopsis gigantea 11061_1 CR5-6]|uniref:Uncharacterized protein n=1 Tax=Phlebiopsis gigantea (strain 11061_1 CR5-6) TaxID=745531 RepID=A0A0C3S3Q5_PHLG1|nr:hypothetical protein PHLGIDRAFT_122361 [Phlebiopsis gigantea 11061_1 CR5-6]
MQIISFALWASALVALSAAHPVPPASNIVARMGSPLEGAPDMYRRDGQVLEARQSVSVLNATATSTSIISANTAVTQVTAGEDDPDGAPPLDQVIESLRPTSGDDRF